MITLLVVATTDEAVVTVTGEMEVAAVECARCRADLIADVTPKRGMQVIVVEPCASCLAEERDAAAEKAAREEETKP